MPDFFRNLLQNYEKFLIYAIVVSFVLLLSAVMPSLFLRSETEKEL